ncbi:MAG: ATP-binding protein [Candidatus Dormibacteraeota bacterium]|nr:ATP-binding protein [Candidatus Dormibacteraeota bacterium]MBO0743993.1 ATP-binding protein [Candidatus Dormibacteraeota bacterium]
MFYVDDGLLIHDRGGPSAWFRLTMHRQELLSRDEWSAQVDREVQRLAALAGMDCQLVGVHRAYGVEDWKLRLLAVTPHPNSGFFEELDSTGDRISNHDSGKEVYLGVRLAADKGTKRWQALRSLFQSSDRWLGLQDPRPDRGTLSEVRRLADRAYRRVQVGGLGARPASAAEIRWLLRRTYWRSLTMPLGEPNRGAWGGEAHELLTGAHVENGYHHLHVVRRDGGEFWVSVLGYSYLPDRMEDAACWLNLHEELDFPVEFQARYRVLAREEAVKAVEAVTARVRDQFDHIREIPDLSVPRALEEQMQETDDIEHSVKVLRRSLVRVWPRLVITGSTEEELRERVQTAVDHFNDELQIRVDVPSGDQRALFLECIPGMPFALPDLYRQEMPLDTLAASGALVATSLGDDSGPYLGVKAEDGTPVHLDPHLASRRNEPTLIGIFGVLGHGKSVCAMKTVWWDRLRGASAAMVAPEGCPRGFLELCRRAGRVNEIWLDDDEQSGNVSLDPYRIMADPFEGAQLAGTMLQTLLPWGQPAEVKTAILAAVSQEAAVHGDRSSLLGAVRLLRSEHGSTPGARAAADVLEFMSRWPVARMLFRESDRHLDLANALTVLQFRGLRLPKREMSPERWTEQHRIATAAMHGMVAIASCISDVGGPEHPKLSFYDDAHVVLANPDGRTTIDAMVLRGRKKHETPIIASQNVTHLLSDAQSEQNTLLSNMAIAMVFRLPDEAEAKAACRVLRISPTEENIRLIQSLGPEVHPGEPPPYSECLLRDLDGNVGRVQIDLERLEIIRAFNTTPGARFLPDTEQEAV